MGERRWVSPKETASLLGLSRATIDRLIAKGEIPAARVGRSLRIDFKKLEARLEDETKGEKKG
jgi:excisionase family DNA binding protein